MNNETYLLPVWVDIRTDDNPDEIIKGINEHLQEFFEMYCEANQHACNQIDIQWSINKHMRT